MEAKDLSKSDALRFVLILGVSSLFADMTYEGARSITGPYLAVLGASATVVGTVAGFGELGVLYDVSVVALIVFSVAAQLASIPMMFLAAREGRPLQHG